MGCQVLGLAREVIDLDDQGREQLVAIVRAQLTAMTAEAHPIAVDLAVGPGAAAEA